MKKVILLLVIIFAISSQAVAQVVPYNENHTVADFQNFLLGSSKKSKVCRAEFLERAQALLKDTLVITEANIPWLCQFLYREEITLPEKGYENTNWDNVSQSLVPCVGHYYPGFCFVLRIGSYEEVIAKGNCFNFIRFQLAKVKAPEIVPLEKGDDYYQEPVQQQRVVYQEPVREVVVYQVAPIQQQSVGVYAYNPPVHYDNYQYSDGCVNQNYQNCSQQQYDNYDYQYQDPGRNPMSGSRENYGPMSGSRGGFGPMGGNRGGNGTMGGSRNGSGPMGGSRGGFGPMGGSRNGSGPMGGNRGGNGTMGGSRGGFGPTSGHR